MSTQISVDPHNSSEKQVLLMSPLFTDGETEVEIFIQNHEAKEQQLRFKLFSISYIFHNLSLSYLSS